VQQLFSYHTSSRSVAAIFSSFIHRNVTLFCVALLLPWLSVELHAQTVQFSYAQVSLNGSFIAPAGVAVDGSGNVFVADSLHSAIYEIPSGCTTSGCVKELGSGFSQPAGVAVDGSGNLFVSDYGNNAVKEILAAGGYATVKTLSGIGYPKGIAVDGNGNVFVANANTSGYLYEILAVGGYATVNALGGFNSPNGVAVDGVGNVYVNDVTGTVYEILAAGGYTTVNTLVGNGYGGIAVDGSGDVFIANASDSAVVEIPSGCAAASCVKTLGDGLSNPGGVAADGNGDVFVADTGNSRVVKIETSSADFGTVAIGQTSAIISLNFTNADLFNGATVGNPVVLTQGAPGLDFSIANGGTCTVGVLQGGSTCAVNVTFTPKLAGLRYGAALLQDGNGNTIGTGYVHGTGSGPQVSFAPARQSNLGSGFGNISGVAVDASGNVFFAESSKGLVKEILAAGGYTTVNTLGSGFNFPLGIAVDGSGNVFVTDYGTSAVYEILAAGGYATVNTLGSGFLNPFAVAVDGNGNVFVADYGHNLVKEILAVGGYTTVNTLGSGFSEPSGIAVDGNGNVFVTNYGHSSVSEILAAGGYATMRSLGSGFMSPFGVSLDGNGNVFVTDASQNTVKEILAAGDYTTVNTLASSGFSYPEGIAVDGSGNVYVADWDHTRLVMLDYADSSRLTFATPTNVGATDTTDGPQTVTIQNIGNAALTFQPSVAGDLSNAVLTGSTVSDCSALAGLQLPQGGQCTLGIEFVPSAEGPLTGFVNVVDNALNAAATQAITLTGSGIAQTLDHFTVTGPTSGVVGAPQSITVTAEDVTNHTDTGYTGTVHFTSTDPQAVLPADYAFMASDKGSHIFSVTFGSVGSQTVTATDTSSLVNGTSAAVGISGATATLGVSPSSVTVTYGRVGSIAVTVTGQTGLAAPSGSVSYTIGSGNAQSAAIVSGSATIPLPSTLSATSYTVTISYGGDGIYAPTTPINVSLTVTAAAVTVTADAQTKVYGTSDPTLTYQSSGLVNGDQLSGILTRAVGETVGPYAILQGTLTAGGNYAINYTPANLTITRANASVTPGAATKVYGTTDPVFGGTLSGFLPADGVTATYARTAGENVAGSPYTISATLSPAAVLANYNITYNTANFTITQALATVTLGSLTQTYDGTPKAASVSTLPSGLFVTPSYTGVSTSYGPTTTPPTNPGTYTVTATVVDPNYTGMATNTLTINQLSPALNLALLAGMPEPSPYATRVYFELAMATVPCPTGQVQFYVDGQVSDSPVLLSGTSCTTAVEYQTATLTPGAHSVYAVYNGDTFYQGATSGTVSHSVTADTVAVTLGTSAGSANVGQAVTFTATVTPTSLDPSAQAPAGIVQFLDSGIAMGTAPLSSTPPYTATYQTSALAAGSHSISAIYVNGDGLFAGNTSSVTVETVNKIAPAIAWAGPADIAYGTKLDATQLNATATDSISGNPITGTWAYDPVAGTVLAVGPRTLSVTFTPDDPATFSPQTATVSINVTAATLVVTPDSASRSYGTDNPTFTYQITGFVNGEDASIVTTQPTLTTTATAASSVAGSPYAITASGAVAANYSISYVAGSLTITAAPLTITANNQTKAYGAALPSLTASYTGFVNGDTSSSLTTQPTLTTTATAASSVAGSPYAITASGAVAANYSISYVAGSLTITAATASVSPNAESKTYGTADPPLTGLLSGFIAADNVQATYSRAAGETVAGGPYLINATLAPAPVLSNYSITYNTANFSISKATLTATANNSSAGYGATPTLSGSLTGVVAGDGITASYTTTATLLSQPGQYSITPVLSDPNNKLGNYTAVLNNGVLTISQDQSTTTLQASATSILSQSSVTFTAKVVAPNSAPTGTVNFLDGSSTIGSATLDNTGTATLTTSTLTVGTHSITAVYANNADFIGSSSNAIIETVQDFSFTVGGATVTTLSATVLPGNTAVYTLQFTPSSGTFAGTVGLQLAGLPPGATYTIVPATIAMGSGTTTVTVTITTAKQSASATMASPKDGNKYLTPLMLAFCLPLFGICKLRRALRLQMRMQALTLVLLAVLAALGMVACGSGGGYFTKPAQTYPMTLTGTSGALHHSVTLDLTVE
jgi:sugar lactone lactonase YvrE